jgi:hypothetical protein
MTLDLTPTITMERLPTELVIQILDYMSTEELKVIGCISFEYRSLVIPFLFRRIRPWPLGATRRGFPDLLLCLQNNRRLCSVVRVLDLLTIRNSQQPLDEIRQIMEIATWWEALILPVDDNIPLSVFDDNKKLRLRRLAFIHPTKLPGPKLSHLLLNILPACANLIELEIPELEEDWFKTCDPNGSAITMWINRLEKYRGPSYPLNYLRNGTPLHRLMMTTTASSPMLQRLGRLVGQRLVALQYSLYAYPDTSLIEKSCLPPSLFPSSFPNLRYISWFLIMPQPESAPDDLVRTHLAPSVLLIHYIQGHPQTEFLRDEAALDVNGTLLDAIRQLHYLRHVWFTSLQNRRTPIEPTLAFVEEVQRISLPYLHAITLWTPNGITWSYGFRKEGVGSVNGGGYTKWACKINVSVRPYVG